MWANLDREERLEMKKTMQAVVYREKGRFTLEERPVPELPGPKRRGGAGDAGFHLFQRPAYQGAASCPGPSLGSSWGTRWWALWSRWASR